MSRIQLVQYVPALVALSYAAHAAAPTFTHDIAPIMYASCASCHRAGEVAPFPLIEYSDVRKHARQIVEVTSSRLMPPWRAEHGYGEFGHDRSLTADQLKTLKDWFDAGAPEGVASALPKLPQFQPGWTLGKPDMVVKMIKPYAVPASGSDIYRNFVIPIQIPPGKYVRAIEYRPGNPNVVHHALACPVSRLEIKAKFVDNGDGVPSALKPPGQMLPFGVGGYAPGTEASQLPDGMALTWPADSDLVLQLHLSPSGKPETEQSSLGFYFTDKKPIQQMGLQILAATALHIDAGKKDYVVTKSLTLNDDEDFYGVFAHMHLIGKTFEAHATLPNGTKAALLKINDWDFRWQLSYQYSKPISLPAGTVIQATFTWDNSAENPKNPSNPPKPVNFGEQTTDEMGGVVFSVIRTRQKAVKKSENADPTGAANNSNGVAANQAKQILTQFDKNNDGKLSTAELEMYIVAKGMERGRSAAIMRQFDTDGDGFLDAKELTEMLASRGR